MIIVWREKEGPILSTYATIRSRLPMAQKQKPEAAKLVDADELTRLVESRHPFDKVFVSEEHAAQVLGWEVDTENEE